MPKGEVRAIEVCRHDARPPGRSGASCTTSTSRSGSTCTRSIRPRRFCLRCRTSRALGLKLADGLWLRLVDLDAALKARSYRAGESVVLEVTDEVCPWNAGRYRVGDDAGRTEDTADLALDTADLAAAYLGGFDFHRLVHAGRADERREGAAEAATLLFRTDLPPYCPEVF